MANAPVLPLKEKLHAIYQNLDRIEKRGSNDKQHYDYVKASDVTRALRAELIAQRVYAEINFDFYGIPFTVARDKNPNAPFSTVMVKCSIVFHDLDSDVTLTSSGLGTGTDQNDKHAYKAMTGALKYALKNGFLVPDEADPEADTSVDDGPQTRQEEPEFNPEFHPARDANPFREPAPAAPTPATPAPAQPAAPEQGDAYEVPEGDDRRPDEAELTLYRTQFSKLSDDLTTTGKLKSSKNLPVNRKVLTFLLKITGAADPQVVTKAQWDNFFARVDKAKSNPEVGLVGLTKLINQANGIEK